MLWLQIFSVPMLIGAAFAIDGAPHGSMNAWWIALGLGVTNTVGALGLYRSFELGSLSVVSPIASTFAAVTVFWSWVFGRAPSVGIVVGLAVVLAGVAMASLTRDDSAALKRGAGVGAALLAAFGFGTTFFGVDLIVDEMGPVWPIFAFRIVGIPALVMVSLLANTGDDNRLMLREAWGRAVAVAALDTAGLCIYGWGLTQGNVAVVAVLSSLFAAVTVFLAQIKLRERLLWWQWLGLGLIFTGVGVVTFLSAP